MAHTLTELVLLAQNGIGFMKNDMLPEDCSVWTGTRWSRLMCFKLSIVQWSSVLLFCVFSAPAGNICNIIKYIKQLNITETECVYRALRTESLNVIRYGVFNWDRNRVSKQYSQSKLGQILGFFAHCESIFGGEGIGPCILIADIRGQLCSSPIFAPVESILLGHRIKV